MVTSRKRTFTKIRTPEGEIDGEDLEFKTVKEEWNRYDLEDGTVLRVKTLVGKISRGIDPKNRKTFFLPTGETLYNVTTNTVVTASVPKETLEKLKKGQNELYNFPLSYASSGVSTPTPRLTTSQYNKGESVVGIPSKTFVKDTTILQPEYASTSFSQIDFYRIISDKKELRLVEPITAMIVFRENRCIMENKEIGIISVSTDYDKCLKDFNDEVFFTWNEYGKADDDKLTDDAKDLKNKILRHVRGQVPHLR